MLVVDLVVLIMDLYLHQQKADQKRIEVVAAVVVAPHLRILVEVKEIMQLLPPEVVAVDRVIKEI
jgi:hypothetical protein